MPLCLLLSRFGTDSQFIGDIFGHLQMFLQHWQGGGRPLLHPGVFEFFRAPFEFRHVFDMVLQHIADVGAVKFFPRELSDVLRLVRAA